ncbi:Lens fiber membrane intrinsic protein [Xenoophorus captivus]|uniref:Lens fiber membrane intrinsic protein n=1 Tax=Xenoophorus captivus TaxID=1517983 RepID=A0ABV0RN80_9TELE
MYSFMGGGLFCAGVGNILLIVSTATDYWMQYRHSSNYMHQGLWRYCVPGKCMTHTDSIGKTRSILAVDASSFLLSNKKKVVELKEAINCSKAHYGLDGKTFKMSLF